MLHTLIRRGRVLALGGLLVVALAVPTAALASTGAGGTGGGAQLSLGTISVVGKVVANVPISFTCDTLETFDWSTGQVTPTTAGMIEYANVTLQQAQGRSVATGSSSFYGSVVCDGSTVNSFVVPTSTTNYPWRNGSAVISATVVVWDSTGYSTDSGSLGPLVVKLSLR